MHWGLPGSGEVGGGGGQHSEARRLDGPCAGAVVRLVFDPLEPIVF